MSPLQNTAVKNGGTLAVLDAAVAGASGLDGADNVHRLIVSNLAENDVAAVQPRGNDGRDEELGAVAMESTLVSDEV
jgi:hypothetical protein